MFQRRTAFVLFAVAALAGCATGSRPASIAETLAATPSLSTLNGLVAQAGLTDTLKGSGPYTVFAPTNEAFKALPAKTLDELGKDPARLKAVLSYHVLPGKVLATDVKTGAAKTVNGASLGLGRAGTFVTADNAIVQTADISASNGVIHTVDQVLIPPVRR
ncbi:MAG: fasciclin domain-containing protein [Burkholderiaceae bacterium]|nr:fasciclin domain-containing protein [Burkholderiaceae bacterium]MDZ4144916.1 fasciclin domain-containing protein [Burkholderiales bacterium]